MTLAMQELLTFTVLYGVSAFLLILGLAAYRGKWRKWALHAPRPRYAEFGKRTYFGFSTLYAGLAFATMTTAGLLGSHGAPEFIRDTFVAAVYAVNTTAVVSLSIVPRFLQPSWHRRWIDDGAVRTDLIPEGGGGNRIYDWAVTRDAKKKKGLQPR